MKNRLSKIITIFSLFLVVGVFIVISFYSFKKDNCIVYTINNDNLNKMDENTLLLFDENEKEEKEERNVIEDIAKVEQEERNIIEDIVKVEQEKKEEPIYTGLYEEREVIQTVVGTLTGYGPDCVGCGGHTSSGFDLTSSIYYEDSEYGIVRILAADPSFPFYSIFRVSNVPTMDDFIGIVLDRGGNVGFGRGTLFDLAFESEGSPDLVPLTRNVTFEMLRSGK